MKKSHTARKKANVYSIISFDKWCTIPLIIQMHGSKAISNDSY